ncbi:MAG: J domain-containing protein [Gammaproteobacteria bacterium]|nr:J domain-containing protein [Gammaproteobacteria bacterium]
MKNSFQHDYSVLELDQGADWSTAQTHYRQQVLAWHPDRFARRPREAVHAQQRFIELTTAYRNLRQFYKINHRMPFEAASNVDSAHKNTASASQSTPRYHTPPNAPIGDINSGSLLNGTKRSVRRAQLNWIQQHWRTALLLGLLVMSTFALFIYTDYSQKQRVIERAKQEQQK